jgi:hypothetical protein
MDKYLFCVLTFITATVAVFLYGDIQFIAGVTDGDLTHYRAMAEAAPELNGNRPTPWVYRIFPSYLAGLLPLSINQSFWLLSIFFAVLLMWSFFFLFRLFGISRFWTFFTLSIFFFNRYLFGIYIFNYFQLVDLLGLLFLILSFIFLYYEYWVALSFTIVLGILTKEVILLLTPAFIFYFYLKRSYKWKIKSLSTLLIPTLFFCKVSIIGPEDGGLYLWEQFNTFKHEFMSAKHWGEVLINSFIPLSFIPLVFFKTTFSFFKKYFYLFTIILFSVGSTHLAGSDERLMIPAAIPFYLLIGTIFEKWGESRDWKVWGIFLLSFTCLFHYNMGVFRHPEKIVTIITYIGSTLAVAGLSLLIRNEKRPFKVNSIMLRSQKRVYKF